MNNIIKERVALIAGSLIDLADMRESALQSTVDLIGINAIQAFLGMEYIDYEISHESLAEDICSFADWYPVLTDPKRTTAELTRIGLLIADLVEDTDPYDEDAAEWLFAILRWRGLMAYIDCNAEEVFGTMRYTEYGLQIPLSELRRIVEYAENRVQYGNMEPCVYISPGERPRIIQYCYYAECNPIDHTSLAR